MIQVSEVQQFAALAAIEAAALSNFTVHLYSKAISPTPDRVLADFTECTFGGYAPKTGQAWIGPLADPIGHVQLMSQNLVWIRTSVPPGETVYGYYVTDAGNTKLLFFEQLDTPVSMGAVGSAVALVLNYAIENPQSTADSF
jgi:hypothetical protein